MLWDVVYKFFVQHIFGGYYRGYFYNFYLFPVAPFGADDYIATGEYKVMTITSISGASYPVSLGNYLSLIATIISMVVIVLICCALIKKIYNMCAHIIG